MDQINLSSHSCSKELLSWAHCMEIRGIINFQPLRFFIWLMTMHLVLLLDITFQGNLP